MRCSCDFENTARPDPSRACPSGRLTLSLYVRVFLFVFVLLVPRAARRTPVSTLHWVLDIGPPPDKGAVRRGPQLRTFLCPFELTCCKHAIVQPPVSSLLSTRHALNKFWLLALRRRNGNKHGMTKAGCWTHSPKQQELSKSPRHPPRGFYIARFHTRKCWS